MQQVEKSVLHNVTFNFVDSAVLLNYLIFFLKFLLNLKFSSFRVKLETYRLQFKNKPKIFSYRIDWLFVAQLLRSRSTRPSFQF